MNWFPIDITIYTVYDPFKDKVFRSNNQLRTSDSLSQQSSVD